MKRIIAVALWIILLQPYENKACSMFYYIDGNTGKIYFANNEDYFYNVKAYIRIHPESKNKFARLWYGWNNFAQGGINQFGLVFDGAVTPKQELPIGFCNPNGRNIGDEILANCKTVDEAITYLENERIGISEGHMIIGDKNGNAVVLEWIKGEKKVVNKKGNMLIATNFLLADTTAGNYPCFRYQIIEERLKQLNNTKTDLDYKLIGNAIAGAAQPPRNDEMGKTGGTLYTTFFDISEMKLILVYKLDNSKITRLDLKKEFLKKRKQKIYLET